jgi:hypothetical protein
MVSHHVGRGLAELYLVSLDADDDNAKKDEVYERAVVYKKDAFWDEVLKVDWDEAEGNEEELYDDGCVKEMGGGGGGGIFVQVTYLGLPFPMIVTMKKYQVVVVSPKGFNLAN